MSKFDETNDLLRAISPYLGSSGGIIEGYTTPMLYVGAPGTTFALHSEDQNRACWRGDLKSFCARGPTSPPNAPPSTLSHCTRAVFSCNFLVAGAPKVWYSVPSAHYCALIAYIHKQFAKDALVKECPQVRACAACSCCRVRVPRPRFAPLTHTSLLLVLAPPRNCCRR